MRVTRDGEELDPAAVVDLTLRRTHLHGGLRFSASVFNLLDTAWSDPVGEEFRQSTIPRDGRSWRLSVGWDF